MRSRGCTATHKVHMSCQQTRFKSYATGLARPFTETVKDMVLDLKGDWSEADVAKLIGSVTDDRDWRLEVSKDGIASLQDKTSDPTGEDYDETLHCFLETWSQGTDFVGPSAAGDKELIGKITKALRDNYPNLKKDKFVYVAL
jgi:hypothetical protein